MSDVWDRSAAFLSDHARPVFAIAALTLFLPSAAQSVLQLATVGAGSGAKLGVGVVALALSLVSFFGQLALIALVLEPGRAARGAFRAAGPRLPAAIGVTLVLLLVLLVAALPLLLLLAADGVDPAAMESGTMPTLSGATTAAIVAYAVIGVPLLAWVGARLLVLTAVVVAERRGLGALRHAFGLTRGHAGRIFGTLLLFVVVGGVAILAVNLAVGTVLRLLIGRPDGFDPAAALTAIVVAAAAAALTVVLVVFTTRLYLALVARRADVAGAPAAS